jgi:hypothetical protein
MKNLILNTLLLSSFALLLFSCEKKPTACIDFDKYVEAGTQWEFESCSEDFEFLTWEFGDGNYGYVGNEEQTTALRTYPEEGLYLLTLTAYADGAFRSDEVTQLMNISYRYVDKIEIVGSSNYVRFVISVGDSIVSAPNAQGSFTAADPFVYEPIQDIRMKPEFVNFRLFGQDQLQNLIPIASENVNLANDKTYPLIIEGNSGFEFKIYWKYKNF